MRKALMAILLSGTIACAADMGKIIVEITGAKSDKGTMMVALVDKKETFLSDKPPLKGIKAPIKDNTSRVVLDSLLFGEYAISVYHDENDNGKLDTKMFIIPKEPYGASNNAPSKYGPPKYEHAKFELKQDSLKKEIRLQ